MNLKSVISLLNPISFWRMDKYGGDNIYDDYGNNTLINHNAILGEDGSTNSNLGDKSINLRGGYLDHTDTGFLNDLVSNQLLHISFNFKCPEQIVGIKPIVSKWFPENQWFLGFENGILVGKIQTDFGLVEVQIDNEYVLYNNRWNHCSFMIYDDEIRIDVNGDSQYISGVTVKNITNVPVIGINSPFLIGGKDSYTMTQDFYINDLAITQKSTKTLNFDIKPLYVLTRDVEERFLDLAPDYYFNVAESFERNEGSTIRNKGTLGNQIYGYLAGADLENFSLVEDVHESGEKKVLFPENGRFVISDILELNLIGDESTNVIFDYNMPQLSSSYRSDVNWYPFKFSNHDPLDSWRFRRRHYFDVYSSIDWKFRIYTYTNNEVGTSLQTSYIEYNAYNPAELSTFYNQNGIFWEKCGRTGLQQYKLKQNTTEETFRHTINYAVMSASYTPPIDQTFSQNYFFSVLTMPKSTAMSLGKIALIKRKLSSYEVAQLKAPESHILYSLLQNYGVLYGWLSCVINENDMRRLYNHDAMRFDYYASNMEFFKHNDPNTNRLNKWNTTYRGQVGTSASLQSYRSTMLDTRNFIWNFFAESITTDAPYILMSYRYYTGSQDRYLSFFANSLNGEYSPGNVEVRFENTFNGSFSTTTPKLNLGGYHMITLTRNEDYYELYIDGILESYYSTGYTHKIDGTTSEFAVNFEDTHYINDICIMSGFADGTGLDPDQFKPMIEFMFQGYHHKITGTSYLQGVPIQSNLHTIESDSLAKIQTNLTDTSGNFSFNLPKSANSTGKYLLSLPIDENATSNVVVHGPYQTSVTYDQISEEPLVGEEVYDMTLDFEPLIFYPTNETVLPILDNSGNSHDATGFVGSDYILDELAFEDQSSSINLHSNTTYLVIPSTGLLTDISTGLTVNLWVKKNISQVNTPLFHFGSTGGNPNDVITVFQFETDNTWRFEVGDSVLRTVTGGLTVGSWTMITLRINPDNTYDFFIGGKVFSHDVCGASAVVDRVDSRIGYAYNGANVYNDDANISHFSIFEYSVPNEELEKMANKGKGHNSNTLKSAIMYDDPMAYYTLDLRKQLIEEISNYDLTVNGSVDYNKNSAIINRDVVGNNYMFNTEYKLLPVDNGGSVEFGFKTTGNHTQSVLLSEWNDTIGEGSYKFQLEAGNILKCYVLDDSYYMESSALNQNEWHLVILTIVNGNIFNLYVDNVLQGSLTLDPLIPVVDYDIANNALIPLAYYRLGEKDNLIDETGNYDGTYLDNALLGETGLLYNRTDNKSIYFDGVDDAIQLNNLLAELQTHGTGSISYLTKFPSGGSGYLSLSNSTNSPRNYIQFAVGETGVLFAIKIDNASNGVNSFAIQTTGALSIDTNYHIVFVQDATDGCLIYINGVLTPTTILNGTPNSKWWSSLPNADSMRLNSIIEGTGATFRESTIDQLTFYSTNLTQQNVTDLYDSSSTASQVYETVVNSLSPLAYYRMNDNPTIMSDEGGNYDGDYLNSPALGTTGLLTNDLNTSVFYDGVDEYSSLTTPFITELKTKLVGSVSFLATFPSSGEVGIYFTDSASNDQDFVLTINETNAKFTFKLDGASAGVDNFTRSTDRTFTANTTYHIVFVQDDTEGVLIYIDGVLTATSNTFGTASNRWFNSATGINTGNINFYERLSPIYYSGTMDELSFYDDRLTQEEITELYKSSKNLAGGQGTPVYGLDRMTIGSDSQGNVLGQIASPTWVDDICFYHKALSQVRRDYHYQYFVNKKETLIGDL